MTVLHEIGRQHLAIELLASEDPHQNEKIRQLDGRFEKLRGLEWYPQWCVGIQIGDGVGKSHTPEVVGRLAITAARSEASYAANGVSQSESGRKSIPGCQRRHAMLADIPHRRYGRPDQTSREDAARLHGRPTEDVAGMGGVISPVVDDIQNLGADDSTEDDQNAQVPGVVRIDPLLARVADTDPQA